MTQRERACCGSPCRKPLSSRQIRSSRSAQPNLKPELAGGFPGFRNPLAGYSWLPVTEGLDMTRRSDRELLPRNGRKLIVGIVARISGCASQKESCLEDQVDHGEEEVVALYSGPVEYRVIATKGKGTDSVSIVSGRNAYVAGCYFSRRETGKRDSLLCHRRLLG